MGIRGRRAVFFDRDGVINDAVVRDGKPYPPHSLAELRIAKGAIELVEELRGRGFALFCVTNQPDVGRGKLARNVVEEMNRFVLNSLRLDDLLTCYHSDADQCGCRKPRPGLLFLAASRHEIALPESFMVGDRWRDIDAGHNAGCKTVWIDRGYEERQPDRAPDARVASLREAGDWILRVGERGSQT